MTEAELMSPREVAQYLRLFEADPRTGDPDPTRPARDKVHGLAFRDPTFPRPIKVGRHNRYLRDEIVAWRDSRPRGGPNAPPSAPGSGTGERRGPKPKHARGVA